MLELVPMSKTGYNRLKEELDRLQKELTEVMHAVAEAREHGDLSENAEYHSGRERQGFIMGRIGELTGALNRADIIDCTKVPCDRAAFGTMVTLLDLDTQEKVTYQLLGPDEADSSEGSISIHSPIGESVLGHPIGDKVSVEIPRGDRHFEIIDISRSEVA